MRQNKRQQKPPFFSEEAEVKMANAVVAIGLLKTRVTRHSVMDMDNSINKVTPTAKRFNNDSVSPGWYQAWISLMIKNGIVKISSGTFFHGLTQEAWCTSSNLEVFYSLHASDMVKSGISGYSTSYDKTVEGIDGNYRLITLFSLW